ncbi:MAG TPA: ABC transporter permease subunit [Bacillota bacterium]|jgi:ABC-type transport system involved in multi-copper enzyme maturation permease subunit|nr:ABC transporter permease subunit [Bacillota bacterium]HOB87883.1 ABC transporter permease subunit [Bacillota bacterium]HOP69423.1 ABC transporter permease subunit [Bacillota bacterium]HPT34371.1 ABC transporter permease subunit [Bacillota bacterium]HPZ65393.1 ABC transporter permease subunit [Bacillota bacterium]
MPSLNLLRKELREQRWIFLFALLLITAMGIFNAWSYKWMPLLEDMAEGFLGSQFGAELSRMLADYNYYLWSQWQPKNLLQMGTILALILAAPAIAGEVNRNTIEFLTSRPIGRKKILATKAAAGILVLTLVIWISTLLTLATGHFLKPELQWGRLLASTVLVNVGLIAVYAIGIVFSNLANDSIKAGALAAGALFLWSGFGLHQSTRVLSPFWHMKGLYWFLEVEPFPWLSLIGLALLAALSLLLAGYLFVKKEF